MATGTTGLTPWLTIWVRPRATIRQIVDTDPRHRVMLLAAAIPLVVVLVPVLCLVLAAR